MRASPASAVREQTPPERALSGFEVVGYGAEDGGDLAGGGAVGVTAAVQRVGDAVQELDEVLDDDGHLFGLLALRLHHRRDRVEHAHLQRLVAAATLGDAELDPLA